MTPTVARWIEASTRRTDAERVFRAAVAVERAAWAAVQREVQNAGTSDTLDDVSLCRRGRAGVPGGAGDGSVADSDRAEGGAA